MARKCESQDVPVNIQEIKDLVGELRSTAKDMTFMLSMFTNITSHVGPKIEPVNIMTGVKSGAALDEVIVDMQMMYTTVSSLTLYVDRRLRLLYQKIDELEGRIEEIEATSSDTVPKAAGCSHQEDGSTQSSASQTFKQDQSTLRLVFKSRGTGQEPSKVTTSLLTSEAPDSERIVSNDQNGERPVFVFGDSLNQADESYSIYASVGNSCNEDTVNIEPGESGTPSDSSTASAETSQKVTRTQRSSEVLECDSPSGSDSTAVVPTSSLSSDVLDLEKRKAARAESTPSSATAVVLTTADTEVDFSVPSTEPEKESPKPTSHPSKFFPMEKLPSSVAVPESAGLASPNATFSVEPDPVPSTTENVVEGAEKKPSFDADSNLDVSDGQLSSNVPGIGATVLTSSDTPAASLSDVEGQTQVSPSSIPTAVVIPRVTPTPSVEERGVVMSSSSTAGSYEAETPPPSPLVALSPSTLPIVMRDTVTLTSSSAPAGSNESQTPPPSPLQALSPTTPSVVARDLIPTSSPATAGSDESQSQSAPAVRESGNTTSSTPPRTAQTSDLVFSSWSPSSTYYPPTPTHSRPTCDSRRYSTASTASVASSSSSGGSPTTTLKYERFVSEPMGNKPVTKLGGVGTTIGSRLRASGYTQASDLHQVFQQHNGDRQSFNSWFRRTAGGNSRHANDCFNSLSDYNY